MNEYSISTQFIDLAAQQKLIRSRIDKAIKKVLDHGQYIMGPEVKQFESDLKEFTGSKHAFTCANGTDALSLVLMAWGIGPGDAVFVPSFTYIATAEAPAQLGATPFFVDVDKDTFNINLKSFKQAILDSRELGLRPAAVIPVDLFGQPAQVDEITDIAHQEKIKVLVDGAQSFGGISNNRRVGSMGDATTTSFFPAKPLGCYGDGGAIFTQDDSDAELINSIRLHGKGSHKYENIRIGMNSRMDTMQAAILIEKLKIFPDELIAREKVANLYTEKLSENIRTPVLSNNLKSAWAQYTIIIEDRDRVQDELKSINIPSVVYYPIPLSEQVGYKQYPSVQTGLNVSNFLSERVLSLPMHPYLKDKEVHDISSAIYQIINS
jgi:dTDP-4-amino-4,6-dideoxygalactose transaminase